MFFYRLYNSAVCCCLIWPPSSVITTRQVLPIGLEGKRVGLRAIALLTFFTCYSTSSMVKAIRNCLLVKLIVLFWPQSEGNWVHASQAHSIRQKLCLLLMLKAFHPTTENTAGAQDLMDAATCLFQMYLCVLVNAECWVAVLFIWPDWTRQTLENTTGPILSSSFSLTTFYSSNVVV